MQQKKLLTIVLILTLSFVGCSKYQKILKKSDKETKYNTALELYQKEDFVTCLQFLDEIIPLFRGTERSQKLYFMYPNCYYKNGDYLMAAYHFKNFTKLFPKAIEAEESYFMAAYCAYLDSPKSSLEQSSTTIAMDELQAFVNKFPQSSKVEQCNQLLDELRQKMAKKELDVALTYFYIESYQAAHISFVNVLKTYPDTKYREMTMEYMVKNMYLYALNSVDSKKEERYRACIDYANQFISAFPLSPNKKEIENYIKLSNNKLLTYQK
jgi:outer membrane protein assembly factor BamD